jgi:hypothetical protein
LPDEALPAAAAAAPADADAAARAAESARQLQAGRALLSCLLPPFFVSCNDDDDDDDSDKCGCRRSWSRSGSRPRLCSAGWPSSSAAASSTEAASEFLRGDVRAVTCMRGRARGQDTRSSEAADAGVLTAGRRRTAAHGLLSLEGLAGQLLRC